MLVMEVAEKHTLKRKSSSAGLNSSSRLGDVTLAGRGMKMTIANAEEADHHKNARERVHV